MWTKDSNGTYAPAPSPLATPKHTFGSDNGVSLIVKFPMIISFDLILQ